MLLTISVAQHRPHVFLGRCPLEDVTGFRSGRFVTSDIDDLLVVQDLGRLQATLRPLQARVEARINRLALLRLVGNNFEPVWVSPPLMSEPLQGSGIAPSVWSAGDIDADGRQELVLVSGDSCVVCSFDSDSIRLVEFELPGAWASDAVCTDIDEDSVDELVTLELPADTTAPGLRLVRVYGFSDSGFSAVSPYVAGLYWGDQARVSITGAVRLEDYPGRVPVFVGVHDQLRPSAYAVLYPAAPDSFAFTTKPFPLQDWFNKEDVLPSGPLSFFNVGDTTVAYGWFVPGSRPTGPKNSFAALLDGEWSLLRMTAVAERLGGPVCRFNYAGTQGWLELRDRVFHFYSGQVFEFIDEEPAGPLFPDLPQQDSDGR
ncbi:MAG: hypothetical protein JSU73_09320 [candidate division WOR-3 bacterium]|nr:MAG: hypothetical protein JSU73_09320 [candidate division WOR-3 bacterium]